MTNRTIGFGWFMLALSLAACGGESESDGSGGASATGGSAGAAGSTGGTAGSTGGTAGTTAVPFDELGDRITAVYCNALAECFGPLYDESVTGVDCETQFGASWNDGTVVTLSAAIDGGTVVYHGEHVEACEAALQALGCDITITRGPSECESVFEGTVDEGGACTQNAECKGELICKADGACPGTCTPLQAVGEPCGQDDHCEDGLMCDGNLETCVAPGEQGDACDGGNPQCRPGYHCLGADEEANTPGVCTSWDSLLTGQPGDACSFTEGPWCEAGNSCAVTSVAGGPVFECVANVASGAACYFGIPSPCPAGEYCNANINVGEHEGTCTTLPSDGEPCVDPGFPTCAPYHVCDDGTCRKVGRIDEACTTNETCFGGNCDNGTCAAGSACSEWE